MMKATVKHDDYMRERLTDGVFAAEYLQAALEEGKPAVLLLALRRIAEARGGLAKLAADTGLAREALYRTLSSTGNPRWTSLAAIFSATGFQLLVKPAAVQRSRGKRAPVRGKRHTLRAAA